MEDNIEDAEKYFKILVEEEMSFGVESVANLRMENGRITSHRKLNPHRVTYMVVKFKSLLVDYVCTMSTIDHNVDLSSLPYC